MNLKNIEEYTKQFGINQQTYELIFKNDDNLPRSKQGSYKELIADTTINIFSSNTLFLNNCLNPFLAVLYSKHLNSMSIIILVKQ